VTGTQVDTQLAGDQTDLVKGNTYTWTGYVNVPAADIWTFVLRADSTGARNTSRRR
jgi:beta-glucosidase